MEHFGQYFKKSKYQFPIVFSKCEFSVVNKKDQKKPNTPKYAQDLVVTWAKPNSVTALLSPLPTVGASKGDFTFWSKREQICNGLTNNRRIASV